MPVDTPATLDFTRRYVRVTGRRPSGLVAFEFAIGEPEVFVELMLPEAAFAEFCAGNDVQMLDADRAEASDCNWRLSDVSPQGPSRIRSPHGASTP